MFLRTLLDRYIFAELLSPFSVSLGALCFVFVTRELLRLVELLVSKGIGIGAVLNVFLHLLPSFLVLTLPIAAIIASITAFGRLSYDQELVAMRASGLSLLRLAQPVVLFAVMIFSLTTALVHWGEPWSNFNLKKVALNLLRDQLVFALDRGVFNEPLPKMMVYVPAGKSDQPPEGIFVSDERSGDEPRIVVARSYSILTDPVTHNLSLRLFDGVVHSRPHDPTQYQQVSFAQYDIKLNIAQAVYGADERPSHADIIRDLDASQWKDPLALRRLVEYHKDLAFPTATLVLCLLGVPAGIVSKRSGRMGGFVVGVFVIVAYYMLNMLCEFLVTTLVVTPVVGAWLPNALFAVITLVAFYRVSRR
ncbi:MAG: LPS export ABC transporter permease LptF [Nitrospiraceae bacterium]